MKVCCAMLRKLTLLSAYATNLIKTVFYVAVCYLYGRHVSVSYTIFNVIYGPLDSLFTKKQRGIQKADLCLCQIRTSAKQSAPNFPALNPTGAHENRSAIILSQHLRLIFLSLLYCYSYQFYPMQQVFLALECFILRKYCRHKSAFNILSLSSESLINAFNYSNRRSILFLMFSTSKSSFLQAHYRHNSSTLSIF